MISCILFAMGGFLSGVVVMSVIVAHRMNQTDRLIETLRQECGAPDPDKEV